MPAASKYGLEIFDPNGVRLADLSGRTQGRRLSKSRNEADEIQWTLDLNEFEAYCRASNKDPNAILMTGRNEVRVKRGTNYLAGGQLLYWRASSNARGKTIEIRATGFLNLLTRRYTSDEFAATDGASIAWQLIQASQALTNGDFGITLGATTTVGLWNKTYNRVSLKEAIQELAESPTRGFDFEFAYNKVLNIYKSIGANRTSDILFEAPGNLIEWELPNDATGIANEVIGIGSGNGTESQVMHTESSLPSQLTYRLAQKFLQRSSTNDSDGTLTDAVKGELTAWAFPFEVPSITVDGNKAPYITDYGIGDVVRVRLRDSDLAKHVDGGFRIERYDLNVDDNDDERVKLSLSI